MNKYMKQYLENLNPGIAPKLTWNFLDAAAKDIARLRTIRIQLSEEIKKGPNIIFPNAAKDIPLAKEGKKIGFKRHNDLLDSTAYAIKTRHHDD